MLDANYAGRIPDWIAFHKSADNSGMKSDGYRCAGVPPAVFVIEGEY
jgi:hypothetical protein